jgi:hypothetical protein
VGLVDQRAGTAIGRQRLRQLVPEGVERATRLGRVVAGEGDANGARELLGGGFDEVLLLQRGGDREQLLAGIEIVQRGEDGDAVPAAS